jgi:plasmid stabilization system protein ParE
MNATYTATATANSKNHQDWGRALAAALADLVQQSESGPAGPRELYGDELRLVIEETTDGVLIHLSWAPGGQDAPGTVA